MSTDVREIHGWPAYNNRANNAYNSLLYGALAERGWQVHEASWRLLYRKARILHVHWPDDFLSRPNAWAAASRAGLVLLVMLKTRASRGVVVWTAHNYEPHEIRYPRLYGLWQKAMARLVSLVLCLTAASSENIDQPAGWLRANGYRGPVRVTPHGPYPMGDVAPRAAPTNVAAAVGQIRRYKQFEALVSAWPATGKYTLRISGANVDADTVSFLLQAAATRQLIDVRVGRLSDDELQQEVLSAALVIAPGIRPNSGVTYLALSAGKPVMVADTPSARELRRQFGRHIVLVPWPPTEADVVQALNEAEAASDVARPEMRSWPEIALMTEDAIVKVVS